MSLRKLAGIEGAIEDLQLEIKPKVVAFAHKPSTPYILYLEKGTPHIKKACRWWDDSQLTKNPSVKRYTNFATATRVLSVSTTQTTATTPGGYIESPLPTDRKSLRMLPVSM